MIQFEAEGKTVNWYNENEMKALFNTVLTAYSKTTDINTAITNAINSLQLGNLSKINKSGNANEYLNGAGQFSTIQAGSDVQLYGATGENTDGAMTQKAVTDAINDVKIYYGECNSAASEITKVVTCPGFTLKNGALIIVYFQNALIDDNASSAVQDSIKLDVNNTGARTVYFTDKTISNFGSAASQRVMPIFKDTTKQYILFYCVGGPYRMVYGAASMNALLAQQALLADSATKLASAQTINGVSFDASTGITFAGICTTAADVAEKVVSIPNYVLTNNSVICVTFNNVNTADNPTLNVNNTGAKAFDSSNITQVKYQIVWLRYYGNKWYVINDVWSVLQNVSVPKADSVVSQRILDLNVDADLNSGIYSFSYDDAIGTLPQMNFNATYSNGIKPCLLIHNSNYDNGYDTVQILMSQSGNDIFYRTTLRWSNHKKWRKISAEVATERE